MTVDDPDRVRRSLQRATRQLEAIAAQLDQVDAATLSADDWLLVRANVGNLFAEFDDAVSEVDLLLDTSGAQSRLLRYLQLRIRETVTKDELSGVAGISEWARRVRELRQDHGWVIHSSVTSDELRVGEYRLEDAQPHADLARDWSAARRCRKLRTSGGVLPPRVRVLEFLKAIYPRAADREQLVHVAGTSQRAADAIEELVRSGHDVVGCTDDAALGQGGYRLGTNEV